jgi:drug/metabolite transporter (DMT)-like permease
VQLAIDDGASPILIAMGRFIVASVVFGSFLLLRRPAAPEKKDMRVFLYLAFIGIGVYYIFQYYGVQYAGPSITSILVTLMCPVMIFLMSYFKLGEVMTATQKLGLVVCTIGGYFVITNGATAFLSNWEVIVGGLFSVVCAIFWAVYTVDGKRLVKKYDPFLATAYLTIIGTVMLAPFAAAEAVATWPASFPLSFWIAALYLGLLCTVMGYVFWFKALTGLSASSTGATLYFEPVVTVIFAWIILGQGIGLITGLGGVLVLVGVVMIARS